MTSTEHHSSFASRFGEGVIRWRWAIIILTVLLGLAAASGARLLGFNQDYRAFFSDENPQLAAFEQMQQTYTKSDSIIITVLPRDGHSVFEQDVLSAIHALTEAAWQFPYSSRVDSITNYQHTIAEEDDLLVGDLVDANELSAGLSAAQLANIREIALNEPSLVSQLVSPDGNASGVFVTFQLPGESLDEMPEAAEAARQLIEQVEAQYPVTLKLTGVIMLNNAFAQSAATDASTLVPLMYLVIIIATLLLVRSFSATVGTIVVLVMSVATAMGLAGWFGILLTPPSASAPTIITTLAVADSVHFLITMLAAMRQGMDKRAAIVESLRVNLQPIFLTSITTAVGFLSLNFSDAPPFRDLGNISAMGVMAAFFYSVLLLPALLAVMPLKIRQRESTMDKRFEQLAALVIRHRNALLAGGALVSIAMISLIPLNNVNDDMVGYFDPSTEFRQANDITLERLTGIYQVEFSLDSGEDNGVSKPVFLQDVEAFTQWLRQQPDVLHVRAITDTFKRLNKNLHQDEENWYRLPEEREQAAQYLLLYELSLPYGLDLNNQLNLNKSATRLVITTRDMNSGEVIAFTENAEQWLHRNTGITAVGAGAAVMFAHIGERNIASMINGTLLAMVIIAGIIMVALRSVDIGLISLIPNLLPAGIAFGIWAVLVGEVNVAVSVVLGMTMGIVVDDSVHFLSKYLRARRELQQTPEQAVTFAFRHVGSAIWVTSLILVAGFAILAQSTFALNAYMATLTAIAIAVAFLADLLLLPPLLMALDRRKPKPADSSASEPSETLALRQ